MSVPHLEPQAAATCMAPPDGEVRQVAGCYRTHTEAFDRALVALAINCAVWLELTEGGWRLLVEPQDLVRVRTELEYYDREQLHWPPQSPNVAPAADGPFLTPLLWAATILGVFWLQGMAPGLSVLGALDAKALFERGEAWRLFTALFLHADGAHLLSNGLSGIFVFSAVLSTWRSRGWAVLAAAAVLGNFASVLVHAGTDYRSIGASTAVFAAVGLLAAQAMVQIRRLRAASWRLIARPLVCALVVLGLFGAGGQQIDVVAHTTGLFAGLLLGVLISPRPTAPLSQDR